MQAAGELASHITQGSIAMVSLPVHVAGLSEAARLLEENINHLDSSYSVADSPFEAPSKAASPRNKDSERIRGI